MIKDYIAFDLETTGLDIETDSIIEIGGVKVRNGKVVDRFMEFVKPLNPISPMITNITGITNEMVMHARDVKTVLYDFIDFCEKDILIGHNLMFDFKFTKKFANMYGISFEKRGIDTLQIARKTLSDLESKRLESLCSYYHITNTSAHRAYHDALATAKIYHMLAHDFEESNPACFQPKELIYRPKKIQPCTKKQLEFIDSLCKQYQLPFPNEAESFTRSEASKYIDHIISIYGRK